MPGLPSAQLTLISFHNSASYISPFSLLSAASYSRKPSVALGALGHSASCHSIAYWLALASCQMCAARMLAPRRTFSSWTRSLSRSCAQLAFLKQVRFKKSGLFRGQTPLGRVRLEWFCDCFSVAHSSSHLTFTDTFFSVIKGPNPHLPRRGQMSPRGQDWDQ